MYSSMFVYGLHKYLNVNCVANYVLCIRRPLSANHFVCNRTRELAQLMHKCPRE